MKKISYIFLFVISFYSCGPREQVNRDVFEEVNRSMEIKKLNEADIIQEAMEWGEEISQAAQMQLMNTLLIVVEENGVTEAISYCNLKALPIIEEVSKKYNVKIRRTSNDYRNPVDKPLPEEQELLEAYAYNTEKGFSNPSNIQKIDDGEVLLFTKAIVIPNAICLNCHGEIGKEIKPETAEMIKKLYPEDKATGHKIGDLRGMWSIRIPKKEVVKRM